MSATQVKVDNFYECSICLHLNHASKLHCSCCGTVPKQYSVIGEPCRFIDNGVNSMGILNLIPVHLAKGYDRAEWHHTKKVYLRTVPADYYAEE